jgi:hypothetical protein
VRNARLVVDDQDVQFSSFRKPGRAAARQLFPSPDSLSQFVTIRRASMLSAASLGINP